MSREARSVEGVTACLKDTYYRGLWGYGSGQACVGDGFHWFSEHFVPEGYTQEARTRGLTIQQLLTEKAAALQPGESGVIALDWFNGNKSVLANSRLSGLFVGMTLSTRAEHLYLAMLEATAFGARVVVEAYRSAGVPVEEICVCGGVAGKNPLLMQIYADVLGMELKVSRSTQAAALGMAVYAAAAAGEETGYRDAIAAAEVMGDRSYAVYVPDAGRSAVYEELYQEYRQLHDYFGRGGNLVMERMQRRREEMNQVKGDAEM